MNKQSSFPLTNKLALSLMKELITPGNPPLGIPFGWTQPDEDTVINFDEVYCQPEPFDLDEYFDFENLTKEQKEFLDNHNFTKNTKIRTTGIWNFSYTIKYSELDREEKYLYRLAILVLNTMTDYHNWAVEYLEYLAGNHASCYQENLEYGYDGNSHDEFLQEAIDNEFIKKESLSLSMFDREDPNYSYTKEIDTEWLEELNEEFNVIDFVFGLDKVFLNKYSYERDVFPFVAWICDWLKELWISGDFVITDPESLENKDLRNFITMINSQTCFSFLEE